MTAEPTTAKRETRGQRYCSRPLWIAGALMLLVALVAKQFVGEPAWIDNLAQTGTLLIGIGIAAELAAKNSGLATYRVAVGIALGSVLLLIWVNGAVGIIGSENNLDNLMYVGVIVVGAVGSVIARFRPKGMARTLIMVALAQTLVALIALVGRMGSGAIEIVTINGFFVALFLGSAALFWKASRGRLDQVAG